MRQSSGLRDEVNRWQREVEAETQRQIERGVAPYDAFERAVIVVQRRRGEKTARKAAMK